MAEASVRDDAPPEKLPLRLRRMRMLKKAAQEAEKRREEQLEWSRRSHEKEGTLQRAEPKMALFEAKRKEEQAAQRVARGQERRKKKSRYASFRDTPNSEACT